MHYAAIDLSRTGKYFEFAPGLGRPQPSSLQKKSDEKAMTVILQVALKKKTISRKRRLEMSKSLLVSKINPAFVDERCSYEEVFIFGKRK